MLYFANNVGWFDAEYVIKRSVLADVIDAVNQVTATFRMPQRLSGLRNSTADQQRHGKAASGRLSWQCTARPTAMGYVTGRDVRRLQRFAAHGYGSQEVPLT